MPPLYCSGGFGTLDELFEMVTWNQLKIHDKKIYILNSAGYYQSPHSSPEANAKGKVYLYETVEKKRIIVRFA